MATVQPREVTSLLTRPPYRAGQFWLVRGLSLLLLGLLLFVVHTALAPHLGIYDVRLITLSLLFATLAVSLNLINGITGQFSIGHAAFYLIGAIGTAFATRNYYQPESIPQPLWLLMMVVLGAVLAGIAGFLIGLPTLRLRGDYLAVATLGFGEIINVFLRNQDGGATSIGGLDLGGNFGLTQVPRMTQTWHIVLLLAFTLAVARNLLKTSHGLAFLSVREDELAADATGVNTTKIKVTAFVLGAAIAGMAGALFAHYNGSVSPDDFRMDVSFMLVAMVVIGGTGSITGAALAGICLKLLEESLRRLKPIPAIDLFALIIAGVLVFAAYGVVKKRGWLDIDGKLRVPLTFLGGLGCAGVAYLAWLLVRAELSIIFKGVGAALAALILIALLATPARRTGLPRLGLLGALVFSATQMAGPLSSFIGSIGPIQELIGRTTYMPSDIRWAVFALALILTMLLRPQGVLGHHELSWAFLQRLFTGRIRAEGRVV